MRATIKASLEKLYHYRCTREECAKWWTIADIHPTIGNSVYCPHCGASYELIEIESPINATPDRAIDSLVL